MRISRKRIHEVAGCDLTPMIDMTFQLIAFFMVVISFVEAEQDEDVQLPSSQLAKPPEMRVEDIYTIHLRQDGRCTFGGEIMPIRQIRRKLIVEAQMLAASKRSTDDATIVIRGDHRTEAGNVRQLIQECQAAQFENFVLRAMEKKAG